MESFSGSIRTSIWIDSGSSQTWQELGNCEAVVLHNTKPSAAKSNLGDFMNRLTKGLVQARPGETGIYPKLDKNMTSILQMFLDFLAYKAEPGININTPQLRSRIIQKNTLLNDPKWSKEKCAGEMLKKLIQHIMDEFGAQILWQKVLSSSGFREKMVEDVLLSKDIFWFIGNSHQRTLYGKIFRIYSDFWFFP